MVYDVRLVNRSFVDVDTYFGSNVFRKGWGECEPFIVGGETHRGVSVGVSIGAKSSDRTKPWFLEKDDVERLVVILKDSVHTSILAVDVDRLDSDRVFRH